ncbi:MULTISPECIES: hypothetical protein [unclassified Variovorax]|jgi:hypothetical protein|uniref:DUF7822 domain-containing protein n=1 Tax=unclassified Variovorax TaxID=663243 RepID=UPI000F7D7F9B|nr:MULTISPECIES: hypothetical protein [unclassified Variovorax]RSZ47233.1 hypothetical protein EJO70_01020 [Variovorax sp. 553]RSZ48644.1 hypothetical protein EJO71_02950 [Variovorax sp. 679]
MANRSYLYSLGNRPASYADRPDTISGLSEWAYDVPFMYRLLMSGDPQLCASLVSDGFDGDEPGRKTRLHAISSGFDPGFERVRRFIGIVRALLAAQASSTEPGPQPTVAAQPDSFLGRLKRLVSPRTAAPAVAAAPVIASTQLSIWLDETIAFLEAHRDRYLLLETIELDTMSEEEEAALRSCVEQEIARCLHVGAAIDALPADLAEAARLLKKATVQKCAAPLDAFFGLRLDDDCDSTRTRATEHPLGLQWSEVLYFELWNRAEFEAQRSQ